MTDKPAFGLEMIRIDPALPCAFDCKKTATVAIAKALEQKVVEGKMLKAWEILPVCDLHLRLSIRDFEVTQRLRENEKEQKE